MNLIEIGTLASLCAGLATVLGAFPALLPLKISDKTLDAFMGFAAGIMLAATSFSLLVPAITAGGVWKTTAGFLLGTLFFILVEKAIPHIHRVTGIQGPPSHLNKLWLFILAITIHNFPEGLTVGVGFGEGDMVHGVNLAIGMALQNIPEGLAIALPMLRENITTRKILLATFCSGIVEPLGGFIGISTVVVAHSLLPYGMSFAAGSMLFVITKEIIPETHSRGNEREASIGLILGFALMMILDNAFI